MDRVGLDRRARAAVAHAAPQVAHVPGLEDELARRLGRAAVGAAGREELLDGVRSAEDAVDQRPHAGPGRSLALVAARAGVGPLAERHGAPDAAEPRAVPDLVDAAAIHRRRLAVRARAGIVAADLRHAVGLDLELMPGENAVRVRHREIVPPTPTATVTAANRSRTCARARA